MMPAPARLISYIYYSLLGIHDYYSHVSISSDMSITCFLLSVTGGSDSILSLGIHIYEGGRIYSIISLSSLRRIVGLLKTWHGMFYQYQRILLFHISVNSAS